VHTIAFDPFEHGGKAAAVGNRMAHIVMREVRHAAAVRCHRRSRRGTSAYPIEEFTKLAKSGGLAKPVGESRNPQELRPKMRRLDPRLKAVRRRQKVPVKRALHWPLARDRTMGDRREAIHRKN
jgi:hypothetical protein